MNWKVRRAFLDSSFAYLLAFISRRDARHIFPVPPPPAPSVGLCGCCKGRSPTPCCVPGARPGPRTRPPGFCMSGPEVGREGASGVPCAECPWFPSPLLGSPSSPVSSCPGEDQTGSKQCSLLGRQSSGPAGHGQAGLTRGSLGAVSAPKALEALVAGQLSAEPRMPMSQVGKPRDRKSTRLNSSHT